MSDIDLSGLTEAVTVADTDILHIRNTGGLDKRITFENLRDTGIDSSITVTSTSTVTLTNYKGNLTITVDSATDIDITLSGNLQDGKTLRVICVNSGVAKVIRTSSSYWYVYNTRELKFLFANSSIYTEYEYNSQEFTRTTLNATNQYVKFANIYISASFTSCDVRFICSTEATLSSRYGDFNFLRFYTRTPGLGASPSITLESITENGHSPVADFGYVINEYITHFEISLYAKYKNEINLGVWLLNQYSELPSSVNVAPIYQGSQVVAPAGYSAASEYTYPLLEKENIFTRNQTIEKTGTAINNVKSTSGDAFNSMNAFTNASALNLFLENGANRYHTGYISASNIWRLYSYLLSLNIITVADATGLTSILKGLNVTGGLTFDSIENKAEETSYLTDTDIYSAYPKYVTPDNATSPGDFTIAYGVYSIKKGPTAATLADLEFQRYNSSNGWEDFKTNIIDNINFSGDNVRIKMNTTLSSGSLTFDVAYQKQF